jgi:Ni/Co efflux regulator RcnB
MTASDGQAGLLPSTSRRLETVNYVCQIAGAGAFSIQIFLGEYAMKLSYALMSAVLLSGVFAVTQAAADDPHHDEHHAAPQGGGQPHGGPPPGGHAPPAGGAPHGTPGGQMHGPAGGHPTGSMMAPSHGNNMMMNGHGSMNGGNQMAGHTNRNFDRHSYQRNFVAPRRFHADVYVRPHGWYEHRWTYGEMLPAYFWTQNYWLSDYNNYGLGDPPPGFVWVRYGNDALLVDQNSGEVLQVEYDVFY